MTEKEAVNHPSHYNQHPAGIEAIDVIEHMPFNIGNAIKYLWRADHKNDPIEDLQKALWYVQRELSRREPPKLEAPEKKNWRLENESLVLAKLLATRAMDELGLDNDSEIHERLASSMVVTCISWLNWAYACGKADALKAQSETN